MMKNGILVLAVLAVLALTVSTADAGRRFYRRGVVRYGRAYYPAVRVRPVRYGYVPVIRPRVYYPSHDHGYRGYGTSVHVRGGNYYYPGGGVHVRTPGFGLDIHY